MAEIFHAKRPYIIDFEKLFPDPNPPFDIAGFGPPNWEMVENVSDKYFEGSVVVQTTKPQDRFEEIKITLYDHGILFDSIETKPTKNKIT